MVKMLDTIPDKNQQKILDKKLDKCRNPENNPDSEMYDIFCCRLMMCFVWTFSFSYKKRMQALLDEDDEVYHKISEENESIDNTSLSIMPHSPDAC